MGNIDWVVLSYCNSFGDITNWIMAIIFIVIIINLILGVFHENNK